LDHLVARESFVIPDEARGAKIRDRRLTAAFLAGPGSAPRFAPDDKELGASPPTG
jgi:hypothetical protein